MSTENKFVGAAIADLHMNAIPIENLERELAIFINRLNKMDNIDLIVFCGDLFHNKIYLNNDWIDLIMRFIHTVVNIAKDRKCKIRMVYGTESHDSNQYDIFQIYETYSSVDFRIIKSVEEETLPGDIRILYLPEEYMEDQGTFYKTYFEKKGFYDYIFGHGVIGEVMTMVHKKSGKKNRLSVPIFGIKDLSRICKGDVFFGHYHVRSGEDNVHYIGSYSRWQHGEEEDKGFYLFEKSGKKYKSDFIVNDLARTYKTYTFGYDYSLFHTKTDDELQNQLLTIKNLVELNKYDFIRLIFNIPEDYENPEFLIGLLKKTLSKYKNVNSDFVNGYVAKKRNIDKEKLDEFLNKYDYIIKNKDTSVEGISNVLSTYIQDKYDRLIEPKTLKSYLTQKLESVLSEDSDVDE